MNTSQSGIGIGDEKGLSFYLFGSLLYRGQGWLVNIRCVNFNSAGIVKHPLTLVIDASTLLGQMDVHDRNIISMNMVVLECLKLKRNLMSSEVIIHSI